MKFFTEKLEKERAPLPEAPKENAEETKRKYMEERNKIRNEENRQKIIEFKKAIKDAQVFTNNSN